MKKNTVCTCNKSYTGKPKKKHKSKSERKFEFEIYRRYKIETNIGALHAPRRNTVIKSPRTIPNFNSGTNN